MEKTRRKNDIVWKGVLEETFEDLLTFVFPHARKELDLKRGFTFLDQELAEINPEPQEPAETRYVDKLVKVYLKDGAERWLLVHVEVQGEHDPQFPARMFQYYYRIRDKHHKPITALAIFSGRMDKGKTPDRFEDICIGTRLTYKFNVLRIMDHDAEKLRRSKNPFALVLWAAKTALLQGKDLDARLLNEKLLIAKALKARGIFTDPKIRAVLIFLNNYVLFREQQTNRIFTQELDNITGKTDTMGIVEQIRQMREAQARSEGLAEGVEVGRAQMLQALLSRKGYSVKKVAEIFKLSVAYVQGIKDMGQA